ncbi:MAG: nucleotide exchange factor GrpE [Deltaproteobacteria bacterium]|nr:nucleotide exchange factor GrpE [Deltaproteobacteria bacterium]
MTGEQQHKETLTEKSASVDLESKQEEEEAGEVTEEPEDRDLAKMLAEREQEIQQLNDRLLRLAADFENTRKRLEREKSESISYANESLLRELLPVIDNLERAVEHGESESDFQGLLDGVRMTLKGFLTVIAKFGCAPFDSIGKAFDPNYHEALMQQESPDHPEKTILQELQKGYTLNERLLRPASVVVSKTSD